MDSRNQEDKKISEPEIILVPQPLEPWEGRARDYKPKLSDEFKKRQILRSNVKILLKDNKKRNNEISEHKINYYNKLENKISNLEKIVEQEKIKKLKSEENLDKEKTSYKSLIKEYQKAQIRWHREKERLEEEILKYKRAQIALESQVKIIQRRVEEKETQYKLEEENLKEARKNFEEKIEELENQLYEHKKKNSLLHKLITEKIEENIEQQEIAVKIDQEKVYLKRKLYAYEEEKNTFDREQKYIHEKLEKARKILKDKINKLEKEKNRNTTLARKFDEATNIINRKSKEKETLEEEIQKIKKDFEILRTERDNLLEERDTLENKVRIYKKRGPYIEGDILISENEEYSIKTKLRSGGMGHVYYALRTSDNLPVTIKTLNLNEEDNSNNKYLRFIQEARVLLNFDHENLVKGLDFYQTPEKCFLVMEYVEGKTLEELLQEKNKLDLRFSIYIIDKIAKSLKHIEKFSLVHRDIKPSNVMLDKKNTVKLMDFGIVKLPNTHLTTSGIIMGTPYYLSPEQITEEYVSIKSDIYSLGITFFQILTGCVPFQGENHVEVISKRLTKAAPPITKFLPDVDKRLSDLIQKMLSRKPKKRPNPEELIKELAELQK